jgi:hypothetical protein
MNSSFKTSMNIKIIPVSKKLECPIDPVQVLYPVYTLINLLNCLLCLLRVYEYIASNALAKSLLDPFSVEISSIMWTKIFEKFVIGQFWAARSFFVRAVFSRVRSVPEKTTKTSNWSLKPLGASGATTNGWWKSPWNMWLYCVIFLEACIIYWFGNEIDECRNLINFSLVIILNLLNKYDENFISFISSKITPRNIESM